MTQTTDWLKVESIELEAQGVAHNAEGKVVFIDGALPGGPPPIAPKSSDPAPACG